MNLLLVWKERRSRLIIFLFIAFLLGSLVLIPRNILAKMNLNFPLSERGSRPTTPPQKPDHPVTPPGKYNSPSNSKPITPPGQVKK